MHQQHPPLRDRRTLNLAHPQPGKKGGLEIIKKLTRHTYVARVSRALRGGGSGKEEPLPCTLGSIGTHESSISPPPRVVGRRRASLRLSYGRVLCSLGAQHRLLHTNNLWVVCNSSCHGRSTLTTVRTVHGSTRRRHISSTPMRCTSCAFMRTPPPPSGSLRDMAQEAAQELRSATAMAHCTHE